MPLTQRAVHRFWTGAIVFGLTANAYLWWPRLRPVPRGDCNDLRTALLAGTPDRASVRRLLGPPTLDAGFHWSYERVCIDLALRGPVSISILFRGDELSHVIY